MASLGRRVTELPPVDFWIMTTQAQPQRHDPEVAAIHLVEALSTPTSLVLRSSMARITGPSGRIGRLEPRRLHELIATGATSSAYSRLTAPSVEALVSKNGHAGPSLTALFH